MSITQVIAPFSSPAPNSNTQTEAEFDANANEFAARLVGLVPELNSWAGQANGVTGAINDLATLIEENAEAAGITQDYAQQAANSAVDAQNVVTGLEQTQQALGQIGIGFAAVQDGDLLITYASPIIDVTMTNGELSITF